MSGLSTVLESGEEVYIPHWPVDVALENLARAGEYLGVDNLINIATKEKNIPAVIVSLAGSAEPAQAANLVKHFVCSARIAGEKLTPASYDNRFAGKLEGIAELFALVCVAQYATFFESGLAKARSQNS